MKHEKIDRVEDKDFKREVMSEIIIMDLYFVYSSCLLLFPFYFLFYFIVYFFIFFFGLSLEDII